MRSRRRAVPAGARRPRRTAADRLRAPAWRPLRARAPAGPRRHVRRLAGHGRAARAPGRGQALSDTLTADGDYLRRFRREAQRRRGLQHPNLVSVYDYDAGERPYLVMEYIEGGDLATLLPSPARRRRSEQLAQRAARGASPHPRRRDPASRHQAAERARRPLRPRAPQRFRDRPPAGCVLAHPQRPSDRDRALYRAGGDGGRAGKRALRSLRARRRARRRRRGKPAPAPPCGSSPTSCAIPTPLGGRYPRPRRWPSSSAARLARPPERRPGLRDRARSRAGLCRPPPAGPPRAFEPTPTGGAGRRRTGAIALAAFGLAAVAAVALAVVLTAGGGDDEGAGMATAPTATAAGRPPRPPAAPASQATG